jgi:hypothetical protein
LANLFEQTLRFHSFLSSYLPQKIISVFSSLPLILLVALLPSAVTSQSPPITAGLIAHYNADSWTGTRWTDVSGYGNHVTNIAGSISVERPVGAPAYIRGNTAAWLKFPDGILPSADYTLFFIARYDGGSKGRIFQGLSSNWLSGFWNGQAGVAYHGACGWITGDQSVSEFYRPDVHGFDWVMGTDRSNSFRSNGVDRTTNSVDRTTNSVCASFDRLAINTGPSAETSNWAIQSIQIYNRKLADAEVLRVEAWLAALQPAFTPANLQVRIDMTSFV